MAEKPEDLNLPASVVTRIIKEAIPEGVNISKDAKTAMSRAASVFILYATTCANTHAMKGKRKTILPNDLFQALADMELDEFLPELKESLEVYKKDQKNKKQAAANRKQQKAANEVKSSENAESINNEESVEMECSSSDNPIPQVLEDCPAEPVQHDSAVTVDSSLPLVLNS